MKVIDIMEPLQHWLSPGMTLQEAIQIMRGARRGHGLSVNGMVALDDDMQLAGIVSTKDILRTILPPGLYIDDVVDDLSWQVWRQNRTEKTQNILVSEIMTEDVRVIKVDDSIMRCADRLLVEQLRRLPVIGRDNRVVGVVYLRDVYNVITELLCEPVMAAADRVL